jgi:hypothetical protein
VASSTTTTTTSTFPYKVRVAEIAPYTKFPAKPNALLFGFSPESYFDGNEYHVRTVAIIIWDVRGTAVNPITVTLNRIQIAQEDQ